MAESVFVDRDAPIERLDLGAGSWVDVARSWLRDPDEVTLVKRPAGPRPPTRDPAALVERMLEAVG